MFIILSWFRINEKVVRNGRGNHSIATDLMQLLVDKITNPIIKLVFASFLVIKRNFAANRHQNHIKICLSVNFPLNLSFIEIFDALQLNDFSGHIGEHFKFVVRASLSHHPNAGKNIFGGVLGYLVTV